MEVWGRGFGVWGLGSGVLGLGSWSGVWGLGSGVGGWGCTRLRARMHTGWPGCGHMGFLSVNLKERNAPALVWDSVLVGV